MVSANLYAVEKYEENAGDYYEVGSGKARTFEDVLDIIGIEYSYYDETDIPNGYQFHTESKSYKWLFGWESKWSLEDGLKDYLNFLNNL